MVLLEYTDGFLDCVVFEEVAFEHAIRYTADTHILPPMKLLQHPKISSHKSLLIVHFVDPSKRISAKC